ncbi:hypothetical protein Tco_1522758 [Tanacetum coccineum]
MSDITNGYLEKKLDWIPGMNNIRLRDFPSFIRTTDIDDTMLNYMMRESEAIPRGSAIVLNTFDALEHDSVNALTVTNPRIFTIGPLDMMQQHFCDDRLKHIGSNLWTEDLSCIDWLDTKDPGSVVYVNFGSPRLDSVGGDDAMMPPEFVEETKGRGMVTSWCAQEEREEVEAYVREMMDGMKGETIRSKALEWKKKVEEATAFGGSSYLNFEKLAFRLLRSEKNKASSANCKRDVFATIRETHSFEDAYITCIENGDLKRFHNEEE